MDFGFATVAAITVLVGIAGFGIKATKMDNKWIPVVCGALGIVLGIVAYAVKMPDFPAYDPVTAAAVGGASGLSATGIHQAVKQLTE